MVPNTSFWYRNGLVPNASGTERDLTSWEPAVSCLPAGTLRTNHEMRNGRDDSYLAQVEKKFIVCDMQRLTVEFTHNHKSTLQHDITATRSLNSLPVYTSLLSLAVLRSLQVSRLHVL